MKPLLLVVLLAAGSLLHAADRETLQAELVKAETDFCAQAGKDGIPAAFLANIAPDGVMLGEGYASRGRTAVEHQYAKLKPGTTLVWKPVIVDVAASGEIGYTTGTWELHVPGENGQPIVRTGRYMTIWKRQADGTWKFVLDGGVADK